VPATELNLTATERAMLSAPDPLARAAASMLVDEHQRWILRQPRAVRRSFLAEVVIAGGGEPLAQERWLLMQEDRVRHSYVRQVLDAEPRGAAPGRPYDTTTTSPSSRSR
jgi:hypothetical protein